jgi:hypothetical protein
MAPGVMGAQTLMRRPSKQFIQGGLQLKFEMQKIEEFVVWGFLGAVPPDTEESMKKLRAERD